MAPAQTVRLNVLFRISSIAIVSLGCLAALTLAAHPGRELFAGSWLLGGAALAFGAQLLGAFLTLAVPALRCHRRLSAVLLLACLATIACCQTLLPLRLRVLLSEPWLRPEANRLLSESSPIRDETLFGLFRFEARGQANGIVYLSTGPYGMFGSAGLAYAPTGLDESLLPARPSSTYDHLYGAWWRYSSTGD